MNVGIIGSGEVAQALGKGFIRHGYETMVGVRRPEKSEAVRKALGARVKTGSLEEAARFGEIAVLAVTGTQAEAAIKPLAKALAGKIVIDVNNPATDEEPKQGVLEYFTGPNDSLLERLQALAPEAKLVKAFSCIGADLMVNPNFGRAKPTMFMCGNDEGAKKQVKKIVEQFGFEPADMGGATAARGIEPLAMLWCIPGFLRNQWNHAFLLLNK